MSAVNRAELATGLRALHAESGGMMILQVVRQQEAESLMLLALAGDDLAHAMLNAAQQVVQQVAAAAKDDPAQCGSCCMPIRDMNFAIAVAVPMVDGPKQALGYAICLQCGPDVKAIRANALKAVRDIWPDAREISVTHAEGGQA